MEFVLFIGNDQTGKSTMSKSLLDLVHRGCKRRAMVASFSDGLRNELVDLYGIPSNIVNNKSIDKNATMLTFGEFSYHQDLPNTWRKHGFIETKPQFKYTTVSLRQLFNIHGTRIRRAEDELYWTKKFDERVKAAKDHYDLVIVDDARDDMDFDYFVDKKHTIYHLTNGTIGKPNPAQDQMNAWIAKNNDRIEKQIKVPIPVLQFTAEKLNIKNVIPKVIPRVVKTPVWR